MSKSLKNFITIDVCHVIAVHAYLASIQLTPLRTTGNSAKIYRSTAAPRVPHAALEREGRLLRVTHDIGSQGYRDFF